MDADKHKETRMEKRRVNALSRTTILIGGAAVIVMGLAGCMSADEQRRANLYEDGGTCADYGAGYGSRVHTSCMLQQQNRRDNEQWLNLERARVSSETARNNVEMLRIMRERRKQQ